jgi:hypothetical protein
MHTPTIKFWSHHSKLHMNSLPTCSSVQLYMYMQETPSILSQHDIHSGFLNLSWKWKTFVPREPRKSRKTFVGAIFFKDGFRGQITNKSWLREGCREGYNWRRCSTRPQAECPFIHPSSTQGVHPSSEHMNNLVVLWIVLDWFMWVQNYVVARLSYAVSVRRTFSRMYEWLAGYVSA